MWFYVSHQARSLTHSAGAQLKSRLGLGQGQGQGHGLGSAFSVTFLTLYSVKTASFKSFQINYLMSTNHSTLYNSSQ
jgi:hypothetical protein